GTYIRSLVDDIGQVLGCGAYVSKLHRTQVTEDPAEKMLTMESLQALRNEIDSEANVLDDQTFTVMDQLLMPMDSAVKTLDSAELDPIAEGFFRNGNPVNFVGTTHYPEDSLIRAYSKDSGLFLGVGFIDSDGKLAPKRSVVYT
ncbi:MAG: tRNA pseudouridine(55) synthase TruB, partial [Sinobacterium sp.]